MLVQSTWLSAIIITKSFSLWFDMKLIQYQISRKYLKKKGKTKSSILKNRMKEIMLALHTKPSPKVSTTVYCICPTRLFEPILKAHFLHILFNEHFQPCEKWSGGGGNLNCYRPTQLWLLQAIIL